MDIEKLGSGCIGIIRCINLAFCQFKQKPGVDGSQTEIVVSFCLFYLFYVLLKPCKLRCREIWGKVHSCLLADDLCNTTVFLLLTVRIDHHICFNTLTDFGSSGALPYNGRCQRLACAAAPRCGCLSLITDSKTCDLLFLDSGLLYEIFYNLDRIAVDLGKIMGNPSFFVDQLSVRKVCSADQIAVHIEQDRLCSLGTLINRKNIFFFHNFHLISARLLQFLQFLLRSFHSSQILPGRFRLQPEHPEVRYSGLCVGTQHQQPDLP